jgi:hypothetical protein
MSFVTQEPQPGTADPDLGDDDTYDQSSLARRIDALDYVSIDHPLLPAVSARSANSVTEILNRIRYHPEFWWDVLVAMQERIHQDKSSNHYQCLRAELIELREVNERLKREGNKLRQQIAKDKTVITYLRRGMASTRGIQTGRAIRLEAPFPETPGGVETNNIGSFSERKRKEQLRLTDAGLKEEIAQG